MTYQFVPQKAKQSINDKKHYQVSRGHFVVKTMCLTWMDEFGWVEVLWRPLECQLSVGPLAATSSQCATKLWMGTFLEILILCQARSG